MRRCLRIHLSTAALILLVLLGLAPRRAAADEARHPLGEVAARAVVRVQVAADPFSFAPALIEDLAHDRTWTPYQKELARRLEHVSFGTGFFITPDGCLVTSAHVVLAGIRYRDLHFTRQQWDSMRRLIEVEKDVWVQVGEGDDSRWYLARVIAMSEDLDLAALRVVVPPGQKGEFAFLTIARSDHLARGQQVLAVGFPEDIYTVSGGEVLSLISGASVHGDMTYVRSRDPETGEETVLVRGVSPGPIGRFQHSAPTGHGNSGGPVLDARGRVVGVAYALLSEVGASGRPRTDLNLALASNVLEDFLRRHGIPFTEAADE